MVNDTSILFGILVFFVVLGGILPLLQADFGETTIINNNVDQILSSASNDAGSINVVSAIGFFLSILKMFFWTFGQLPLIIDLFIFIPIRLIFFFILAKTIRGTGG